MSWCLLHLENLNSEDFRTLEPIWTEGTMTIQVDEALEEVADNYQKYFDICCMMLLHFVWNQSFMQRSASGLWSRMTQKLIVCRYIPLQSSFASPCFEHFCTATHVFYCDVGSQYGLARLQMIPRGESKWDHWESVHKQATTVSKINIKTSFIVHYLFIFI